MLHQSARSTLAALALAAFGVAACDMGGKADSKMQAAVDSTPMVAHDSGPSLTDANIFAILDEANREDSAGGALAVKKGTSKDVKEFGAMMVRDHHSLRQDGQDLARTLSVTPELPAKDNSKPKADSAAAALAAAAKGPAFDRAYIDHEVTGHTEVLATAKSLRTIAQNSDLQSMIDKATPVIQAHLDKALEIQKKMGGGLAAKADRGNKAGNTKKAP